MSLSPGDVFAGYTIIRLLGSGGMGEVYLAQHPRLPRRDALKILRPDVSGEPDFRQRFIREADLAAALSHPNIVTVYDRGEFDEQLWIATEFLDGPDAARLLQDRYPAGMPIEDVSAIVASIASALDHAHQAGLLHRDVKPANILRTGEGQRIALADFGIAREIADSGGLTATNMTLGTVAYAAPEQLMGDKLDGRADQYALAASAFHLLTGSTLFANSNPVVVISQHLSSPPPKLGDCRSELSGLDEVFATALAKSPAERYPSCTEFARDFAKRAADAYRSSSAPTQAAIPNATLTARAPTQASLTLNHPHGGPSPAQAPSDNEPTGAQRGNHRALIAGVAATTLLLAAGAWAVPRLTSDGNSGGAVSAESTNASTSAAMEKSTTKDGDTTVEAVGFGHPADSDYMWVTSIVRDVPPGRFAVVSFNLLGPDGSLIATESQTEMGVNPGAKMFIGRQVTVPKGKDVAKVEATVGISPGSLKPKFENVVLEVGQYSLGTDAFGRPSAEAVITNPSQSMISSTRVGIACFDKAGAIIGGGSNFPALLPARGKVKVSADVLVSQPPERCEMTASPSDF